ncbi:MAG: ribosome-binding factor A [Candidatus Liptonbacteria bacterium CG11_big_fil_rev_8_21_14_0_20_35_14]|uniref:Ribosome-binding factor A n=1 Tax=Candidatus Liptonbacteria bacterium CG11_big_fil_rev_8_21_14_0_20_35_14 TaxID=1974634 RepID=A0A2H0N948_9BACT|nr:MAG: ribosome-binding factor A [Candidatus Liptonbacteria bacterium CG11_big_fil_rev_8_21_14_0_20_35_14]
MSQFKQARLESVLKDEISKIIMRDIETHKALVTITEIVISKKNESAKIGISIIPANKKNLVFNELKKNQGAIQRKLIKKINIYFVPQIDFVIDEGLEHASHIERLLKNK